MATSVPQKSTNVRQKKPLWVRGMGALQALSPQAAARAAGWLFFRTPPRAAGADASALFAQAERRELYVPERVSVWSWGQGPVVLLLHGWGGRASQLRSFVPALREAGYRVVAFDAPGHGHSAGRTLSLPRYAHALAAVASSCGPVEGIIAHSFGGAAATLAFSRGLAAKRAVLIGPPSSPVGWFEQMCRGLGLDAQTQALALAHVEATAGAPLRSFRIEEVGPRVPVPTLVIHDREDREVPFVSGQRVAQFVPGAALHETAGLGHRRILHDQEVLSRALSFLGAPPHEHGCERCGRSRDESWDPSGRLCLVCALSLELSDREARWAQWAA